jgi:hypothetical protein
MALSDNKTVREQRLAAQLRENLKRRKLQARSQARSQAQALQDPPLPNDESSG